MGCWYKSMWKCDHPQILQTPQRGRILKSEMIMPARTRRRYTKEFKREAVAVGA
jgi:hypothetical protein